MENTEVYYEKQALAIITHSHHFGSCVLLVHSLKCVHSVKEDLKAC